MLLSYKWMDGIGLGSLCGAIIRASLRDANKILIMFRQVWTIVLLILHGTAMQKKMLTLLPPRPNVHYIYCSASQKL